MSDLAAEYNVELQKNKLHLGLSGDRTATEYRHSRSKKLPLFPTGF